VTGGVCRFGVLGPLVFERDGEAVVVPSGRQRALLAVLLRDAGRPVSRDRLIDELWGEQPPASAVSALHVHLSKLRALLGGLLLLEPAGYTLSADGLELDVWRFDALVDQARAEPEAAIALLAEALALFRGEPLCDVAAEGSVAQWRRALEEKRLHVTGLRIDAELAAGAGAELIAELELLAAQHPYEERLWGQLMLALYRAGRQADALEAYQRARRQFAVELGLEPGEPLTRLQNQILARDEALLPASPEPESARASSRAASSPARSDLPQPLTRLVGRERELTALAGLMADPDVRMITFTGPGGVGKTRLLLELARRHEREYADGAVFVRLERLIDPGLVSAEIANAVAKRDGTDLPSADGLAGHLRALEMLLVIDNFEHVMPAAVALAELLAEAPRIRVLVSSRTTLRLRGEQVFDVEPLQLPGSEEEISHSPAVQLFLQCALAANRRLEIDAEVTRTLATICRALDGLPLAIELAASRSQSLTPAQIADQLAQPLLIGQHALRDLPDRQQSIQATMRWSYDLLSPGAREVLAAAGVFLGGFSPEALAAVAGCEVGSAFDELQEASLVRRQADGDRWELLELVRAFALGELSASGGQAECQARHRAYFAAMVAEMPDPFVEGGLPSELAAPVLADHANLRAALLNAIDAGDQDATLTLALGLRPVWLTGMLRQECQELVDRLLARFAVPGVAEVALLRVALFLDYTTGAPAWGRRLADRAGAIGDLETLATAIGNLFAQAMNARDVEAIERLRPELLALITSEAGPKGLGWIHYFLALDAYVENRFAEACEHAEVCAQKAQEIGHEYMRANAAATLLLARSARDGVIRQPELAETLEVMRPPGVQPLAAVGLWLTARYAAGVAPEAAYRWLAHAERILTALDSELWPESVLRDETLAVLGTEDLGPWLVTTPPLDHAAALAEAAAWAAARDPNEVTPRPDPSKLPQLQYTRPSSV
jgi:predicted ATPase/DNA-binding SARP family transcriptional activator